MFAPLFRAHEFEQLNGAAVLRRWTLDAQYERQLVTADDGGTIGLDYYRGAHTAKSLLVDAPVLLVLHGVTGTCCARVLELRPASLPPMPSATARSSGLPRWPHHCMVSCPAPSSMDTPGAPYICYSSPSLASQQADLSRITLVLIRFRRVSFGLCSCSAGGSDEGYCKWMCAAAHARGWRPVVMNFRGCNGLELTSPKVRAGLPSPIHQEPSWTSVRSSRAELASSEPDPAPQCCSVDSDIAACADALLNPAHAMLLKGLLISP